MQTAAIQPKPKFAAFFKYEKRKYPNQNKKIEIIKRVVASHLEIQESDIYKKGRKHHAPCLSRYLISYFIKMNNITTLINTVYAFRGAISDHTTIMHGVAKIHKMIRNEPGFKELIAKMDLDINERFKHLTQ